MTIQRIITTNGFGVVEVRTDTHSIQFQVSPQHIFQMPSQFIFKGGYGVHEAFEGSELQRVVLNTSKKQVTMDFYPGEQKVVEVSSIVLETSKGNLEMKLYPNPMDVRVIVR